jgi:hypothetical protein
MECNITNSRLKTFCAVRVKDWEKSWTYSQLNCNTDEAIWLHWTLAWYLKWKGVRRLPRSRPKQPHLWQEWNHRLRNQDLLFGREGISIHNLNLIIFSMVHEYHQRQLFIAGIKTAFSEVETIQIKELVVMFICYRYLYFSLSLSVTVTYAVP